MSIWGTFFTLSSDSPLGPPYEVTWPEQAEPIPDSFVDVAKAVGSWAGIRLSVHSEEGLETDVVLSNAQVDALIAALQEFRNHS